MPIIQSIGQRINYYLGGGLRKKAVSAQPPQSSAPPIVSRLHEVEAKRARLSFRKRFLYQYFLRVALSSLPYREQIEQIINGKRAYVTLGGPNGGDLIGPEGIHSPQGWDRAYVLNIDRYLSLCAKGTGLARGNGYQSVTYGVGEQELHLPFDINPRAMFIDHTVRGGNDYKDLVENAEGAFTLLQLAFGLGRERGGILLPLSIKKIKEFPVPLRDRQGNLVKDEKGELIWTNMAGWNYFTNPEVFTDEEKLKKVAGFVERRAKFKPIKWIARRYKNDIEKGKIVSKLLRWLVGKAFMHYHRPSVYHYLGDSFRIGNAYRQLLSNGYSFLERGLVEHGLVTESEMKAFKARAKAEGVSCFTYISNEKIKHYLDAVIASVYAPVGGVDLPPSCRHDLGKENGRLAYLREVTERNGPKADELRKKIVHEIACQLGIIHGVGGNGGGHEAMHALGKLKLILEHSVDGRIVYAVIKLQDKEKEPTYTLELYSDNEEKAALPASLDLGSCKIIAVESDKHGKFRAGSPGGGVARPDNLGFGLRDLHDISTFPQELVSLLSKYPEEINNLNIKEVVRHFHLKMMQEAELNLLFAGNLGEQIGDEMVRVRGGIYQLNALFGAGEEGLKKLTDLFWQEYHKWYGLSAEKYLISLDREIEQHHPIYVIKGSYRIEEARRQLDEYFRSIETPGAESIAA